MNYDLPIDSARTKNSILGTFLRTGADSSFESIEFNVKDESTPPAMLRLAPVEPDLGDASRFSILTGLIAHDSPSPSCRS